MTKYEYPELDEVLYRDSLPNGLQIAVVPRRGFEKKIAYLVTGFGSHHTSFTLDGTEYTVPGGVAHYLEHKMFELPADGMSAANLRRWGQMSMPLPATT